MTTSARADGDRCIRTLDFARQLRNAGKMHDALRALDDCSICEDSEEVCDASRISLRSAMPTVVVRVDDPDGRAVDTKLFVDDESAPVEQAIELDPGTHRLRVEGTGRPISERTVQLDEHDKVRLEIVVAPAPVTPPKVVTTRSMPASVWVVGSSALAALTVSGIVMGVAWQKEADASSALQATQYSPQYRLALYDTKMSNAQDLVLAADVLCAVGVAALVATAVIYFARPTRTVTVAATGVSLRF